MSREQQAAKNTSIENQLKENPTLFPVTWGERYSLQVLQLPNHSKWIIAKSW